MNTRNAKLTPTKPVRADHRVIRKILDSNHPDKVVHIPTEYDRVSRVFVKAGGSWQGVFDGSVADLKLLKKIIEVAIKYGHLTPALQW